MVIIWGSKGNIIDLGLITKHYCPICEKETNYHVSVVYRYGHIFWMPLFKWSTKYYLTCEICERGVELKKKDIKPYLIKDPIPWMHRLGWIAALIILGLFVLFVNTC
jgi:hypothetical protein